MQRKVEMRKSVSVSQILKKYADLLWIKCHALASFSQFLKTSQLELTF